MIKGKSSVEACLFFFFAVMMAFSFLGTLSPTWIFFNALQLVAHLPLLNTPMPPLVHNSLLQLLSFCRLDWLVNGLGYYMGDTSSDAIAGVGMDFTFNEIRLACGYTDQYAHYVIITLFFACATSVINILIYQLLGRMCPTQRAVLMLEAVSLANFTVRLVCLFVLQILISLWVTLSTLFDASQESKNGKETVLAAVVVAGFFVFLIGVLLVGFFCGYGIGPQSSAPLYKEGTFWSSYFEKREVLLDKQTLIKLVQDDKHLLELAKSHN